jgi:putative transposase
MDRPMESLFSTLEIERTNRKIYAARDEVRANVFDYIERFYKLSADTRHWDI